MVVLVSDERSVFAQNVRKILLSHGVPCALSDTACLVELLPAFAVVTDKKNIRIVSAMCGFNCTPYRTFCELCDLSDAEICAGRIFQWLEERGLNIKNFVFGRYALQNSKLFFCGNEIYLTRSEAIITALLFSGKGRWFTPECIARYCHPSLNCRNPGVVRVHIHNINSKCSAYPMTQLVETRRFCGYRLNDVC